MNQECAVGYASEADIDAWMDLVALVRDAFPGLSLGEYRGNLRKAIAERRYREDDPLGAAPRALYKRLGFEEAELVTRYGYPCQQFVLRRGSGDK